jgi:DNA polymerase-3 subunit epsilon
MNKKTITVFDTETTGFLPRKGSDLSLYPHMAEIYAMQVDPETDEVIKEFDTLIKIKIPMPEGAGKVNGITDEMLADKPTFIEIWRDIAEVFVGAQVAVAANYKYDEGVLVHELMRIGKEFSFPYPPEQFCTIQNAQSLFGGRRMSNSKLYEKAMGKPFEGAHRAKADVQATYEVYKWLQQKISG